MLLSREDSDYSEACRREADESQYALMLGATWRGIVNSISPLDAADLACTDEFAKLLQNEHATPNEIGRYILVARNAWADRVAQRMCE